MTPELKYPDWQEALQAVVRESNPQLLREKLQKLDALMSARCRELEDELDALNDGRVSIRLLRNQGYR
jgi:hypothetical protein